ncbi:MAG: uracil-DNA glycosylase [Saprospiraceae bacterium]|jgi:uracil-DNA glycosylase
MIILDIGSSWETRLRDEFRKDSFLGLKKFLKEEENQHQVYPPSDKIFEAFNLTPFNNVKVVILGQDPYHGKGQAHGLSFSVPEGVKTPPSLRNIFKELSSDLSAETPKSNCLENWARQGVLMLNATLTVRAKTPGSHQKQGWEEFTDAVIQKLSDQKENLVFVLWGIYAQNKGTVIDTKKHLVLTSAHPSPFSAHRGFLGSKVFSKINEHLISKGENEINWISL